MLNIPKKVVDQDRDPFPPGVYDGELVSFELRKDQEEGQEVTGAWLRPSFVNLQPVDDKTPDPGARPFSGYGAEIQIVYKGESLMDLEANGGVQDWEKVAYPLRRAAGLIAQAALAFGVATRAEDGSAGVSVSEFIETALAENSPFNGRKVRIRVSNRTPAKDRDGNTIPVAQRRTFDQLEGIYPQAQE